MPNMTMKKSKINMSKTVKDMPVSLFLKEDWKDYDSKFFYRKDEKDKFYTMKDFENMERGRPLEDGLNGVYKPCMNSIVD